MAEEPYRTHCYCQNCKNTPEVTIPFGTSIDDFDYNEVSCELCGIKSLTAITNKPSTEEL